MGDAWPRRLSAPSASLLVATALVLLTPAVLAAQGPAGGPRETTTSPTLDPTELRVDLVFFDGVELSDRMLSRVRSEVEVVFAGVGVEVGWVDRLNDPMQPRVNPEIRVILLDRPPADWGLGEHVMGTVLGKRFPRVTVYVFYPSVLRVIKRYGYEPGPNTRTPALGSESPQVAKAVARVLAHEVIHVLTPGQPHAAAGLMQASLGEPELLATEAVVDATFLDAFRSGLVAAIRSQQRLVTVPEGGGQYRK